MSPVLTIDEFKLLRSVCEIRYANAFLIYDRTGQILRELSDSFTNLNVASPGPNQTLFVSDEGNFGLEVTKSHFIADTPNPKLEHFALHCNTYFDAITKLLEVKVFTRIGLRTVWRKEFKTEEEAQEALSSIDLLNLKPGPRFAVTGSPTEVIVRWQDKEFGILMRLQAGVVELDAELPFDLKEPSESKIHKKIISLALDVDYYTIAPVERAQWTPAEWIPQKARLIRKELDKILQGDRK
jgi:hypothetical protein